MSKFYTYLTKTFTTILVFLVFVLSTQMERDMDVTQRKYNAGKGLAHITGVSKSSVASSAHLPSKQDNTKHKHPRKMHVAKHITLKLAVPSMDEDYHINLLAAASFTPSLPDAYRFLFFREINPPPPKNC